MKNFVLLLLILVYPLYSQENLVELPKMRSAPQKIIIAKADFGDKIKYVNMKKLEAAVTLAAALSKKYYLIPMGKVDSVAQYLKKSKEYPTAIRVARELNTKKILFFNINRLERILRVGLTSVKTDSVNFREEGEGYAAIRYLNKADDEPVVDPALLTAVQRAFADMDDDSLMYDNAEGSFRVYPAEPLVIGTIDFIDNKDLPKWEVFQSKEVYSYDALEIIFEEAVKKPNYVVYDNLTRDSLYAMLGLHVVENFNAPSKLELEILSKMDVKYYITGALKRVEGGAYLELYFCEIINNKLNILRSAEGILKEDSMEDMRELVKKLAGKILVSGSGEK